MRRIADTVEPNLLRHIFPTHRLPRVSFAEGSLQVQVPSEAWCIDTTLSQGVLCLGAPGPARAAELHALLERLDNQSGLLRRMEIRVEGPVGRDLLEVVQQRVARQEGRLEPVVAFPLIYDAPEAVRGLGVREAGLPFGISDYHTHLGQGGTRSEQLGRLLGVMDACLAESIQPRLDVIDVTRADLEGFLLPVIEACLAHLAKHGAARLKVRLCDTAGLGLPWTEAPVPRSVPRLLHSLRFALGLQPTQLEFLGANDMGLALANTLSAVMHGCAGVACAVGGVGERAGVAPLEHVLVHLAGLVGAEPDLVRVAELHAWLEALGQGTGPRHPLWGSDALTTVLPPSLRPLEQTTELLAPFDTGRLLERLPRLALRAQSGAMGVAYLVHERFPEAALQPGDLAAREVHRRLGEEGVGEVSWAVVEPKLRELAPEVLAPTSAEKEG